MHHMHHTEPIAPHLTRHGAVGKERRPDGDPVAALKDITRFEPVPRPAPANLLVPLEVFNPKASESAAKVGKLIFHCVGDTGGVHGTATQEAIAEAMESQISTAAAGEQPSFFYNLGDVIYCGSVPQHVSPYRMSMTQPHVYWTLDAPFVTIIGLYSNVEGSLDARGRNEQQQLEDHMTKTPANKRLLITVHHPPFSLDAPPWRFTRYPQRVGPRQ